MKILISTTLGHNPGDEIIALGVKNLLKAKYGPDLEYIEYNRNPDLQTQDAGERRQRVGLVGNYMTSGSILRYVDLVVLAGSPEWRGGPLEALYQGIQTYAPDIPLYALGIGAGNQWGSLTKLDTEILSRRETVITTRSEETTSFLAANKVASKAMACPALFAFELGVIPSKVNSKTLLILQKPGHGWHEVRESCLEGIPPDGSIDILTLHVKEYEYYSERGYKCHYAANPTSFAYLVSQYSRVISTRLHGAIGALSLGVPAIIVAEGDFRMETCAEMFGSILPVVKNVREALATPASSTQELRNEFRLASFAEHVKALG